MLNEGVYLQSARLTLVPYLPHHVQQYHAWMSDAELLASTESEPLTLAEERDNQAAWLQATDKMTFILLAHTNAPRSSSGGDDDVVTKGSSSRDVKVMPQMRCDSVDDDGASRHGSSLSPLLLQPELATRFVPHTTLDLFTAAPVHADSDAASPPMQIVMIGDCNLFLLHDGSDSEADDDNDDNDADDDDAATTTTTTPRVFEVEVMLAERSFRRRGLAEEAVRMVMQYAVAVCGATRFVAKILARNDASVRLFEQRLHFDLLRRVPVFGEVHYTRTLATCAQRRRWHDECVRQQQQHTSSAHDTVQSTTATTHMRALYVCGPYTRAMEQCTGT